VFDGCCGFVFDIGTFGLGRSFGVEVKLEFDVEWRGELELELTLELELEFEFEFEFELGFEFGFECGLIFEFKFRCASIMAAYDSGVWSEFECKYAALSWEAVRGLKLGWIWVVFGINPGSALLNIFFFFAGNDDSFRWRFLITLLFIEIGRFPLWSFKYNPQAFFFFFFFFFFFYEWVLEFPLNCCCCL